MTTDTNPQHRSASELVSVVMATHNGAETITAAIESVQAQSTNDWELIVVENGSTDGTAAIVAAMAAQDPRIQLLTAPTANAPAARNQGLTAASGSHIALLDDDDLYTTTAFERHLDHLRRDVDLGISVGLRVETDMERVPMTVWDSPAEATVDDFLVGHPFCPVSVMVRADALRSVAVDGVLFDPAMWAADDTDMFARLTLAGVKNRRLDHVVGHRRLRAKTSSQSLLAETTEFRMRQRMLVDPRLGREPWHWHRRVRAASSLSWGLVAAASADHGSAQVLLGRWVGHLEDPSTAMATLRNAIVHGVCVGTTPATTLGRHRDWLPPVLLREARVLDGCVADSTLLRGAYHHLFGRVDEAAEAFAEVQAEGAELERVVDLVRWQASLHQQHLGGDGADHAVGRTSAAWQATRPTSAPSAATLRTPPAPTGATPSAPNNVRRVAVLMNLFPVMSETFILGDIVSMLTEGNDVHLFPHHAMPDEATVHPDVDRWGLLGRVHPLGTHMRHRDRLHPVAQRLLRGAMHRLRTGHRLRAKHESLRVDPSLASSMWGQLRQHGPFDVVHAHFGTNGLLAVDLRRQGAFRSPIVTTFHGGYDIGTYVVDHGRDVYAQLFEEGDCILAVSERIHGQLLALGAPPSRTHVHYLGVDVPAVPRPVRSNDTVEVVVVGRLVAQKGMDDAIKAMALVAAISPQTDVRLTVVGEGPSRPSLEDLVATLGMQDRVSFLGGCTTNAVRAQLLDSDIFILPSRTAKDTHEEGLPITLKEAMATGLAVIATRHSAVPELVDHDDNGLLVDESDPAGIADAIIRLAGDRDLRARLGVRAHARVRDQHERRRQHDRLTQMYDGLRR